MSLPSILDLFAITVERMSTSSESSDDRTSKKKERLEQNRLSARESRKRKKVSK